MLDYRILYLHLLPKLWEFIRVPSISAWGQEILVTSRSSEQMLGMSRGDGKESWTRLP